MEIDGSGKIWIPYRTRDGELFRYRTISRTGARRWDRGEGTSLFGIDTLPEEGHPHSGHVLVCEGESDTLAARETLGSTHHVTCLGCPGATSFRPEWVEHFDVATAVYVIGDADEAGSRFEYQVAALLIDAGAEVVVPGGLINGELVGHLGRGNDVRSITQSPQGTQLMAEHLDKRLRETLMLTYWAQCASPDELIAVVDSEFERLRLMPRDTS